MWTEHFWMGGMWIFPFIMIIVILFLAFSRGCIPRWHKLLACATRT